MAADRCCVLELAAMFIPTDPFPVPEAPLDTVIQLAFARAVHVCDCEDVFTAMVAVPPEAGSERKNGNAVVRRQLSTGVGLFDHNQFVCRIVPEQIPTSPRIGVVIHNE